MSTLKPIVTMTSWKGRILNVPKVLDSIAAQTEIPVKIELNLSEEEFPGREKDLPDGVTYWSSKGKVWGGSIYAPEIKLEIHWVERNTKSFKKLIPTIQRHFTERERPILTIDDDVIYPPFFIRDFLRASEEYPDHIISNNFCRGMYSGQQCVNGAGTLYKPKFFTPFLWEELTDDVIATNADDWWYSFCLWITGVRPIRYIPIKMEFFNEVSPNENSEIDPRVVLQRKWLEVIHRPEVSGGAGK